MLTVEDTREKVQVVPIRCQVSFICVAAGKARRLERHTYPSTIAGSCSGSTMQNQMED